MKRYLFILSCVVWFIGCTGEAPQQPSSMVMEAWIDAGGYPVVLIHQSYVFANAKDSANKLSDIITQHLIPFGKVTISDGERTEILIGRLDTMYMPPYTYSTIHMKGEVGKTYTVTAQWENLYAEATSTIPPVAELDSVEIGADSTGLVNAYGYMTVDTLSDAYYALFIRERNTKQFLFMPFGVFENRDAEHGLLKMQLYNPFSDTINNPKQVVDYWRDSTHMEPRRYQLKIARIDYPAYRFWKAYNERILTRGILFVPVYRNIPSNVEGGLGYFNGLGSTTYPIDMNKDTVYRYQ